VANIKLGELLIKAKVIDDAQLRSALVEQRKWGGRLGDILVRMNLLTEEVLVKALAHQLHVPIVNVDAIAQLPEAVRAKVPLKQATALSALPVELLDDGKVLKVAMSEPQNLRSIDTLQGLSRCRVQPVLAAPSAITRAIGRLYNDNSELSQSAKETTGSFKLVDVQGRMVERKGAPAPAPGGADPLKVFEENQRKELAALKALVELLIEKAVFTREEFSARLNKK
jgi:hypothetical protein